MKIAGVKGMNDILPGQVARWQEMERVAREVFALYGYREVRTPVVEPYALFARGVRAINVGLAAFAELIQASSKKAQEEALRVLRIPVVERIPLLPTVHPLNQHYLDTKARRMRHWLDAAFTGGNGRPLRGNGSGRGFTSTTTA